MKLGIWACAAASLAWALLSQSAHATTWTVDCSAGTIGTVSGGVTTPVESGLPQGDILGALLGNPLGPGQVTSPVLAPNDVVLINSLCNEEVTIRTSGLTLSNPSFPGGPSLNTGDGVVGQLEVAGAANTVIDGISLGPTPTAGGELANLYIHDGASVALKQSQVINSPIIGILVARSSSLAVTDTVISGNGAASATPSQTGMGILAENNSTLTLGNDAGTKSATIQSNTGSGVVIDDASSVIVNAATISGNQLTQVTVLGASSGFMTGLTTSPGTVAPTTTIVAPSGGCCQAIFASGASTLDIEQGVVVTGNQTNAAILLEGSSLLLNASLISSGAGAATPVKSQATITATANAVIALASGNSICFGTLTVATPPQCTLLDTGPAIVLSHVATLVQVGGSVLGYPVTADTVTGAGSAQLQSTMDLGIGVLAGNAPSLNWTTGSKGINMSQNSSFRLEGGVSITGALLLAQASNAFFNLSNNHGNTTPNTISAGVSCPFTAIPASHVSISGSPVTPAPTLATSMSSATSPQCLAF